MKDLAGLFQALWGTFLMRDIIGKAVPGAVLLGAAGLAICEVAGKNFFLVLNPQSFSKLPASISLMLALASLGVCYIAGFVAQTVAFEWFSALYKYYDWEKIVEDGLKVLENEKAESNTSQPNMDTQKNFKKLLKNVALKLHIQFSLNQFGSVAEREPLKWYQRERFVVIKEMSANMSMALALGVLVTLVGDAILLYTSGFNKLEFDPVESFSIVLMLIAVLVLWRCHVAHREAQTKYEIDVLYLNSDRSVLAYVLRREYATQIQNVGTDK